MRPTVASWLPCLLILGALSGCGSTVTSVEVQKVSTVTQVEHTSVYALSEPQSVDTGKGIIKFKAWKDHLVGDVLARRDSSAATGFFIKRAGRVYLVTAAHALPPSDWEWTVGKEFKVGEIIINPTYDVAAVELVGADVPTLDWAVHPASTTGYQVDLEQSRTEVGPLKVFRVGIPVLHGMSGSPLFLDDKVVGVLTSEVTTVGGIVAEFTAINQVFESL
jgi:hypothetical protein